LDIIDAVAEEPDESEVHDLVSRALDGDKDALAELRE